MMANNDAERLLDENFIATDESHPFDRLEEENIRYGDFKYKKKNGFNFTSSWRKPKIGRRKPRSISKNLGPYDMTINDDSTRGKYVKGRESFETFASVPLSDFDEAKDMLPFLNVRNDNLNMKKTLKDKTVLNPKMFLSQPPVNRREIKNKFKREKTLDKNSEEEESRDIFKPIHNKNNDNVFDAFQLHPKESPSKVKSKNDTEQKLKEEEPEDLDKENFVKESFYCGDLYNDHGPILSSLSEDTLHSDSVRGEQFLEDEVDPKSQWNPTLNPNFEELEEDTSGLRDASSRSDVERAETMESVDQTTKVETSVETFSDRLKRFQSKDAQAAQKFGSYSTKSKSTKSNASTLSTNLLDSKAEKYEEESNERIESTVVPEVSDFGNPASDLANRDKLVGSGTSNLNENVTNERNQLNISELKTSIRNCDRHMKPSEVTRNNVTQLQTLTEPTVPTSSYKMQNTKQIDDKKCTDSSQKKILVQSSEKIESKVVDLSLIGSYRNQAARKGMERDDPISQTNSAEPSSCTEDTMKSSKGEMESSKSYRFQRTSDVSMRSTRSYNANYRSSVSSQKTTSGFEGKFLGRRASKPRESDSKPIIDDKEENKIASSEFISEPSQTVRSDEPNDHVAPVATDAPLEVDTKKTETKKEKPRDSFMAARLRFGGKVESSTSKFGRNVGSNTQRSEKVQTTEEKKETTASDDQSNQMGISKLDQDEPLDTKKRSNVFVAKKPFESLSSEVDIDKGTPDSNGDQKKVTKSSIRKSSLNLVSKNTMVGGTVPSMERTTSVISPPVATSLEPENREGKTHGTSNESTANTSISTLTCDSAVPKSFAQQSASIFGVTLSKSRKKRTESAPEPKDEKRLSTKQSIETGSVFADKSESQTGLDDLEATRRASEAVENETQKSEKKSSIVEGYKSRKISTSSNGHRQISTSSHGYRPRKISTSSVSVHSVESKLKPENSQEKEEEGPAVAAQQVKIDQNNHNGLADGAQSDESSLKAKPISVPQKLKSRSISDRLKMFEKANARSRKAPNRDNDNIQPNVQHEPVHSDSPKSVETSGSSSSFDNLSVATKRRDTGSGITTVHDELESPQGQVANSPFRNQDKDDESIELGDRRKTLKSTRNTIATSTSLKSQPKSSEMNSSVLIKSEVVQNTKNETFGQNFVASNNRTETFKNQQKEENIAKQQENSAKGNAYSMRRKFFENLDRKRVQASMSRPLVSQTEPMPTHNKFHREQEIEVVKDDISLREDNDLPMFVEVEEDFMLRDNISTCLSASENRSVICKPDALLYSVSQKAIALMSAKAESNSVRSYARSYRDDEKGTIDNGLNFNREESSAKFRSRFARKTMTNNKKELADSAQDEDDEDRGSPVENQRANKFRGSAFSQRSNRFTRTNVASEMRHQSNDEEIVGSADIPDTNEKKNQSLIETEEPTEKRTTACFNRSSYNSFTRKKDYGTRPETKSWQRPSKEDTSGNIENAQDGSDNSRPSMNSEEKDPVNNNKDDEPDSNKIASMSIKARRKFFESQLGNSSAGANKSKKEESTAKYRPSVGSEMTALAGESIASQFEPMSHTNNVSESEAGPRKRVSSTSMGTLDYSLQSSSVCSRPSDFSKRASTTSSNTHGTSSGRFYRNGFSSTTANRQSTSSSQVGKKNSDLRCF